MLEMKESDKEIKTSSITSIESATSLDNLTSSSNLLDLLSGRNRDSEISKNHDDDLNQKKSSSALDLNINTKSRSCPQTKNDFFVYGQDLDFSPYGSLLAEVQLCNHNLNIKLSTYHHQLLN